VPGSKWGRNDFVRPFIGVSAAGGVRPVLQHGVAFAAQQTLPPSFRRPCSCLFLSPGVYACGTKDQNDLPIFRQPPSAAGGKSDRGWAILVRRRKRLGLGKGAYATILAEELKQRRSRFPRPFTGVSAAGGVRPVLQHGLAFVSHSRCHARSRASSSPRRGRNRDAASLHARSALTQPTGLFSP
jgi:hypothetical protein